MTFGERLRDLRSENDLSLADVAEAVGLTRTTILRYESGAIVNVPPETVHKLATFFGVTRPYMMGWTDERGVNPHENLEKVADKLRSTPEGDVITEYGDVYWRAIGQQGADCTTAATQAVRALIKYGIARTPVYPQHIIQHADNASFVTYGHPGEIDEYSMFTECDASRIGHNFYMINVYDSYKGKKHYLFVVNRNADIGHLKLSLAVELGHIYLGHEAMLRNRTKKKQEAECFAMHLVFPRAAIKLLQEHHFHFTKKTFSRIFGDCDWCLDSLLTARPVEVNPELNGLLKEQFTPYINQLDDLGILKMPVHDEPIDLSNYMAGYKD